jgi:hypothetical protein
MAKFCHFWRLAPGDYWRLTANEYRAMVDYQNDYIRKERAAAHRRH